MQYHLNGYRPGDPNVSAPEELAHHGKDRIDVAIIGCGPAGLTLAAQLAKIGGMSVRIFEMKSGPLAVGQADGIACRSMEMFEAFGFVEKVAREYNWVMKRYSGDRVTMVRVCAAPTAFRMWRMTCPTNRMSS